MQKMKPISCSLRDNSAIHPSIYGSSILPFHLWGVPALIRHHSGNRIAVKSRGRVALMLRLAYDGSEPVGRFAGRENVGLNVSIIHGSVAIERGIIVLGIMLVRALAGRSVKGTLQSLTRHRCNTARGADRTMGGDRCSGGSELGRVGRGSDVAGGRRSVEVILLIILVLIIMVITIFRVRVLVSLGE